MRNFILIIVLLTSQPAFAGSWRYNPNAGFGIYQPEGWHLTQEGRSSRIRGPDNDFAQSEIFIGSDWQSEIKTLEHLKNYVLRKESSPPQVLLLSGLNGFKTGSDIQGKYFLLREPQNIIVVEFELRGSKEQMEEGMTSLSSIEIRRKGIEYPAP